MAIDKEKHNDQEQTFLKTVGYKLNEIRKDRKLKQHEVINILKLEYQYTISTQHLSNIENGIGNVRLYEVALLCSIYNVSIEEILKNCKKEYTTGLLPSYNRQRNKNMKEKEVIALIDKLENEFIEICKILR